MSAGGCLEEADGEIMMFVIIGRNNDPSSTTTTTHAAPMMRSAADGEADEKSERASTTTHGRACKRRAAEFRDELLFAQPESAHKGDCPISFVPLPLDVGKSAIYSC
eukprot:scaffold2660_cov116-Skeletonema_dohrnii-CCMP3373.AAC.2